jgi:hypothetical protein
MKSLDSDLLYEGEKQQRGASVRCKGWGSIFIVFWETTQLIGGKGKDLN